MSEVKVNKISPRTGTATTVGDSGDTFTVPSGANLVVAGTLNPSGTITAGSIAGTAIADNAIDSDHYTDGSIDTAHIANDQITAALIADNAIDSDMYVDGSIDNAHIADDAIDSEHYADGSIDTAHYAAGSVDTTALGADAVTAAKIADDVVNSEHLAAGGIDTEHLGALQVTGAKLNTDVISAQTELASAPADADEFMVSDGGVLKRIDYSLIKGGDNTPFFFAHSSTSQSVTSATWTKVTLGTELIDTDSAFASDRFTVPSGKDGKYMLQGSLNTYGNNDTTKVFVAIYKNGAVLATTYNFMTNTDQDVRHYTADITTIDDASAGDYYEIYGNLVGSSLYFSHDSATPRSTNFLGYKLIG